MARIVPQLLLVLALVITAGCATMSRQPVMRDAVITPTELTPQAKAVISVQIKDKYNIVKRVEAVVREDTRIKLKLHDDGEAPDAKAGDGIWTLQVDVPFHAATGEYTLDITAYNSKADPILVRTKEGEVKPLATTCKVVIKPAAQ